MIHRFIALLLLIAVAISAGGLACVDTVEAIDLSEESDGAT